jgi:hypothetical protein
VNGIEDTVLSIVISLAILVFIIYSQLRPRKISQKGLILFPAIVLFFLIKSFSSFQPTQKDSIELVIMSITTIVFGLLACRQLQVYKGPTERAMSKGSWTYFLWWLAAFVIKILLSILFGDTSFKSVNQTEIFLPVFFLIVTRNAYLYWKTKKLGLVLH